jgi:hypothetical protein
MTFPQRSDDFTQELVLVVQAACDLGHDGLRQGQVLQGVVQGLGGPWRLASITLKTCMGLQATALSGFGWLCGVSFEGGHSMLPLTVLLAMHGWKETDFSVVLFRPDFMLASAKCPMKAHKNQQLLAMPCSPDSLMEP